MGELAPAFVERLKKILSGDALYLDPADRWPYGQDNSRKHALPDAVALVSTHDHVVQLVRLCNEFNVPIVGRGRGTNTSGSAVPISGGLVVSFERMDKQQPIDRANRMVRAEAGALNQSVQDAAAKQGFFWPPDPTSAAYCTIGGNIAVNAGGPRALKYGATRENVLALTAVTGTGETIRTGTQTTKSAIGYDLTRLLIGSEGTLALVTDAVLKLTPLPETRRTLQAVYGSIHAATDAVAAIMAQPAIPCALEFIDRAAIQMIRGYSKADLPNDAGAMLIIEVDGAEVAMNYTTDAITRAATNSGLLRITLAKTKQEADALWATRKALSPALRNIAPNKLNEDVVVPVSRIPELIDGVDELSKKYDIPIVNFGHAGNGNIHVNLLYDTQDPKQEANALPCLSAVFDLVIRLEGTLSGEHGIGLAKRDYVPRAIDAATLAAMRAIKRQFDPKGILNPGKLLPPGD
jgi:D-lactate dehydrogenase